MALFREKGRQNNARVFLKDFERSKDRSYFLSIGNSVTSPTESVRLSADTVESDQYTWDNMFFMNQVFSTDVCLMIKKIEWTPGTRYEAFDKSKNQYTLTEKFYAYNTLNNNVYLCLSSPDNGQTSAYAPTGETIDPEVKSDGYIWKFLYKVNSLDLEKFNYPGFLPIKEIGTELYTDERILQQNVELNTIKGSIEAIDVVNQGSPYIDIVNNNFISNNYYPYSVYNDTETDGNVYDIIEIDTLGRQISGVDNYYDNNKYVIHFENGYTGLIVSSSKIVSPETGDNTILRLRVCNLFPTRFALPTLSEKYTIIPYIKIIGNGEGAIAIPIFSQDKRLIRVSMLNIGKNYSYAEAQIQVINGSTLKPVFSLNGLGSNIAEILGAKHVLISKKITPITNLSQTDPLIYSASENIGIVFNGPQYQNVITENTYYTQLALIKNPQILNNENLVEIAGTEISEVREMVIEAIDPKIIITIGRPSTPYTNTNSFFEINDIIVRGPDNYPDQFRAKIVSVSVTGFSTTLTCDLINGAFETYAGYRIKNLKETTETGDDVFFIFQDCQNNCSNAISVSYLNTYTPQDFVSDDAIFGFTSLQTAQVQPRLAPYTYVNPLYPNRAKVRVINPNSGFLAGRYEDGEYVPGEIVSGLKIQNNVNTVTKKGTLVSISEPIQIINSPSLGACYILECAIDRSGIDTPFELVNSDGISLETNVIIRQGLNGPIGKIVRTAIPGGTGDTNIVYLYVNNFNSKFEVNENTIYQINDLYNPTTYKNMKLTVQNIIYEPSLIKYSGNLLYINDAGPIQRRLENNENLKLLIEF